MTVAYIRFSITSNENTMKYHSLVRSRFFSDTYCRPEAPLGKSSRMLSLLFSRMMSRFKTTFKKSRNSGLLFTPELTSKFTENKLISDK